MIYDNGTEEKKLQQKMKKKKKKNNEQLFNSSAQRKYFLAIECCATDIDTLFFIQSDANISINVVMYTNRWIVIAFLHISSIFNVFDVQLTTLNAHPCKPY